MQFQVPVESYSSLYEKDFILLSGNGNERKIRTCHGVVVTFPGYFCA